MRLYHQLQHLTKRHDVSLLSFVRDGQDVEPSVAAACRRVTTVPRSRWSSATSAVANVHRLPASVGLYWDPRMARALCDAVRAGGVDLLVLQLVRMASYVCDGRTLPVVLDLLDAAGPSMAERAALAPPGLGPLFTIESRRLANFERAAVVRADLSLLISQRDRARIDRNTKTRVNANGIDLHAATSERGARDHSTIAFSGTMSFPLNADAATWFARHVLPLVSLEVPSVTFRIVGRDPGRRLTALGEPGRIVVTGAVASVSAELARATVAVCPVRFGSGLQTKILEAMAVGTPVVCTSKAAEGLPGTLASHVVVADDAGAFARGVVSVLRTPQAVLERAASAVRALASSHTWHHSVTELEGYFAEAIELHTASRASR